MTNPFKIALLHGAGYAGGELISLLAGHPEIDLSAVTSRTFAGKPVWYAHPSLRHQTSLAFSDVDDLNLFDMDGILIAAEHGKSAGTLTELIRNGYPGVLVDLSADFRLQRTDLYRTWYNFEHPAHDVLEEFVYGLPEVRSPYPEGSKWIANPGCFATGISLALWPAAEHLDEAHFRVTALTGASGSGASPKPTTHYPTRDGNVRAYKVLAHQHLPEILQVVGEHHRVSFTPVSGPWTRGIWGTAQVSLPDSVSLEVVSDWYTRSYAGRPLIRLWPDALPELRYAAYTPFCDIGWVVQEHELVVGFAIDNLLKGAASQAIQNLNILLGLPETLGLLPVGKHAYSD